MRSKVPSHSSRTEGIGSVLVELLVALPIVLLLIGAILSFGSVFVERARLLNALGATMRMVVMSGMPESVSCERILAAVNNALIEQQIDPTQFRVEVSEVNLNENQGFGACIPDAVPSLKVSVRRLSSNGLSGVFARFALPYDAQLVSTFEVDKELSPGPPIGGGVICHS